MFPYTRRNSVHIPGLSSYDSSAVSGFGMLLGNFAYIAKQGLSTILSRPKLYFPEKPW